MTSLLKLKPAFTLYAPITKVHPIGELNTGGTQVFAEVGEGATLKSEPGFEPAFNATMALGGDWLHVDPKGKNMRMDVRSILTTDDGASLSFSFTGVMDLTPENGLVISSSPDAKSTQYGTSANTASITCGNPKYASLQNKVFIGTSRYHITEKGMAVEWTHFEVVPVPQSA